MITTPIKVGQRYTWKDDYGGVFIAELTEIVDASRAIAAMTIIQILSGSAFRVGGSYPRESISERYYTYLEGQDKP